MWIIRGGPIKGGNAHRAVNSCLEPRPGELMISWSWLVLFAFFHSLLPFHSLSFSFPVSLPLSLFLSSVARHSRRGEHYHCTHCYDFIGQVRHNATIQRVLITGVGTPSFFFSKIITMAFTVILRSQKAKS